MEFSTSNVTGFKPGINTLRISAEFKSSRTDETGPKHIIVSIPDSFTRQIVWSPKQLGDVKGMPFNKYTFKDGTVLHKEEQMTAAQSNEFELSNYIKDTSKLLKTICGEDATVSGRTLEEYSENVAKAIDGKLVDVKLIYDKPNPTNGKYYLGFPKKDWVAAANSKTLSVTAGEQLLIDKVKELATNPTSEHTSSGSPSGDDEAPF